MLHMNEALLGSSLCPPSEFQPFDVTISEGSHVAVRISFKAMFSIPRDHAPCTPGLRPCVFHLAEAAMILPVALHKFLMTKKNFRYFIWFELSKCRLGKVNKVKSQNPSFSLHGKSWYEINIQKSNSNSVFRRTSTGVSVLFCFWQTLSLQKSKSYRTIFDFCGHLLLS